VSETHQQPSLELRADCARCLGLCCVASEFSASADFAIDKPAGQACPHLGTDFRCGIHARLRQQGFRGCAVFDCFGAGQHVSQVTFAGADWRRQPWLAQRMFDVFTVMRELHELLWHLSEALRHPSAGHLRQDLTAALDETRCLSEASAATVLALDLDAHWRKVNTLLQRFSQRARSRVQPPRPEHERADLIGADLRGARLDGANLRGACLIRARLTRASLRLADLTSADLRDADLCGADLRRALFVTQAQVDAASGDASTRLPPGLTRPAHWSLRGEVRWPDHAPG
jgi:uncharacterized protein YjbI with pentapeptide repeats